MSMFELAKRPNAMDYASSAYGVEFSTKTKPQKAKCPFHTEASSSFAYYEKSNSFFCFGCEWSGTLIDFVAKSDGVEAHEAAKKICDAHNIEWRDEKYKAPKKKQDLNADFKAYNEFLNDNITDCWEQVKAVFVKPQNLLEHKGLWNCLGYDIEEKSLVIGITDENGQVTNTKHRTKRDKEGKWIGAFGGKTAIFPFEYLVRAEPTELLICEGEKDALNACSVGIPSATLGGASTSWKNIESEFFSGITQIYIAFDYDVAGYGGALNRLTELSIKTKAEIFCIFWDRVLGYEPPLKFDFSDFLARHKALDLAELWAKLNEGALRYAPKRLESKEMQTKMALATLQTALLENNKVRETLSESLFLDLMVKHADDIKSARDVGEFEKAKYAHLALKNFISDAKGDKAELKSAFTSAFARANKIIDKDKNSAIAEIIEHFAHTARKFNSAIDNFNEDVYYWAFTHWQILDMRLLKLFIYNDFLEAINLPIGYKTEKLSKDLVENLKIYGKTLSIAEKKERQERNVEIVTLNGVLKITPHGVELLGHNKNRGDRYCLSIAYNPEAEAPMFNAYLEQTLEEPSAAMVILEFFAYSFMDTNRHNKLLILNGHGNNGKSVLMNIIKGIFPKEFLEFEGTFEGFGVANLVGKKLNICADRGIEGLAEGELETLKKLTAADSFKAKMMFTQKGVLMENPPKILMSVNDLPKNIDQAFLNRMLIMQFNKTFTENSADLTKRAKKGLAKKILDNEKEGILKMIVDAAIRLLKQDKFTFCASSEKAKDELSKDSNNAYRFADEQLIFKEGSWLSLDVAYLEYTKFCTGGGYRPQSKETFSKSIRKRFKLNADDIKRAKDVEGKWFRKIMNVSLNYNVEVDYAV